MRVGTVRAGAALGLIEEIIIREWLTRAEDSRDVQ